MNEQTIEQQTFDPGQHTDRGASMTESVTQSAKGMLSKTADMAQQATEMAKGAATDTASNVAFSVKGLLNRQVDDGAELVAHFAHSVKCAADDLDNRAPQVAAVVRGISGRIDSWAQDLRGRSVDQLMQTGADFTRRQPALVLGLATLAGFFAVRALSTPSNRSSGLSSGEDATDHQAGGVDDV